MSVDYIIAICYLVILFLALIITFVFWSRELRIKRIKQLAILKSHKSYLEHLEAKINALESDKSDIGL